MIPLDYYASLDNNVWRYDMDGLIHEQAFDAIFNEQNRRILVYINSLSGDVKDLVLLSYPTIRDRCNGYLCLYKYIVSADEAKVPVRSSFTEAVYITEGDRKYLDEFTPRLLMQTPSKFSFIRRFLRTLSWSSLSDVMANLFKPEVIAIGHNDLIRSQAKYTSHSVKFYQARTILDLAIQQYEKTDSLKDLVDVSIESLSADIFDVMYGFTEADGLYWGNFKKLVLKYVQSVLHRDNRALNACKYYDKLPTNVWLVSGTSYANRLIGLSVKSNGGTVRAHAHAHGNILISSFDVLWLNEYCVCNEYVEVSNKSCEVISCEVEKGNIANVGKEISILPSIKPTFSQLNHTYSENTDVYKVMYISTAITRGLSRGWLFSNDMVYLYWQNQICEFVSSLPVDFTFLPHPEGAFVDPKLRHPLVDQYGDVSKSFENEYRDADLFIFDCPHSTTFSKALLTDKPIIRFYLQHDSVLRGLNTYIDKVVGDRCINVGIEFNDKNLPVFDRLLLREVIVNNRKYRVDNSVIESLLIY